MDRSSLRRRLDELAAIVVAAALASWLPAVIQELVNDHVGFPDNSFWSRMLFASERGGLAVAKFYLERVGTIGFDLLSHRKKLLRGKMCSLRTQQNPHPDNPPGPIALAILDQWTRSGKGFGRVEIGLPYIDDGCQSLGSAQLILAGSLSRRWLRGARAHAIVTIRGRRSGIRKEFGIRTLTRRIEDDAPASPCQGGATGTRQGSGVPRLRGLRSG